MAKIHHINFTSILILTLVINFLNIHSNGVIDTPAESGEGNIKYKHYITLQNIISS